MSNFDHDQVCQWLGMNEIIVTRPRQQDALDIVARHLDAFVAGLTDSLVFGYLLHSEGECSAGYTVRGAVIYEDDQSETNNATIVYSE